MLPALEDSRLPLSVFGFHLFEQTAIRENNRAGKAQDPDPERESKKKKKKVTAPYSAHHRESLARRRVSPRVCGGAGWSRIPALERPFGARMRAMTFYLMLVPVKVPREQKPSESAKPVIYYRGRFA